MKTTVSRRCIPWLRTFGHVLVVLPVVLALPPYNSAEAVDRPQLLEPKLGAVLDNDRTDGRNSMVWRFRWTEVEGAEAYRLYVIHRRALNPVVNVRVTGTSYIYRAKNYGIPEQNRRGWTWKVRAICDGREMPWSETGLFEVEPVH